MFDFYLALGDSMSIDYYASQDAENNGLGLFEKIGAASLLFSNESILFPEFARRDLLTLFPGIKHLNLCIDGATCDDLFDELDSNELASITGVGTIVTLTQGGNDLLHAYRRSLEGQDIVNLFGKLQANYVKAITQIRNRFPGCLLLISTVYDPTDGTGILPTDSAFYGGNMPIQYLDKFNDLVRSLTNKKSVVLADVQQHFLGHGATCGSTENFWYWKPSPIEPSYRGASEIRKVWLEAIESCM